MIANVPLDIHPNVRDRFLNVDKLAEMAVAVRDGTCVNAMAREIIALRIERDQLKARFDLGYWLKRHANWSQNTFAGGDPQGIIKHIRKELREVSRDPSDPKEWIDVIILAIDGFQRFVRNGMVAGAVEAEMIDKQNINMARKWPAIEDQKPGEAIEHDRSGEAFSVEPLIDDQDLDIRDAGEIFQKVGEEIAKLQADLEKAHFERDTFKERLDRDRKALYRLRDQTSEAMKLIMPKNGSSLTQAVATLIAEKSAMAEIVSKVDHKKAVDTASDEDLKHMLKVIKGQSAWVSWRNTCEVLLQSLIARQTGGKS